MLKELGCNCSNSTQTRLNQRKAGEGLVRLILGLSKTFFSTFNKIRLVYSAPTNRNLRALTEMKALTKTGPIFVSYSVYTGVGYVEREMVKKAHEKFSLCDMYAMQCNCNVKCSCAWF